MGIVGYKDMILEKLDFKDNIDNDDDTYTVRATKNKKKIKTIFMKKKTVNIN